MGISNPHLINSFNFVAFVISGFLLAYSILAGGTNRKHKRFFIALLSTIIFTTIFAIVSWELQPWALAMNGKNWVYKVREICDTLYYFGHIMTAFLFTLYILEFTSFMTWRKWWAYALLSAPAILVSLMVLLNPVFHYFWTYTVVDGVYAYTRASYLWITYLMAAVYAIGGVFMFVVSSSSLRPKIRYSIYVLFSVTFAGVAIQFFFPSYQVELVTESITLAGMLINMEDHIKFVDPITRLPNRDSFDNDMNKLMNTKHSFTVVILHIDNFPHYSRVMKKSLSSEMLNYLANNLRKLPHVFDTYKVASSCFALILNHTKEARITDFKIALGTFLNEEYVLNNVPLRFAASITMAKVPDDIADLDLFSYLIEAKEDFLNTEVKFLGIDYINQVKRHAIVEKAIRDGILNHNFELYYQPIYSAKSDKIIAAEALCRLIDPKLGLISPGEFIPIAEETGMMNEIGDQIYDQACRFISSGVLQKYGLEYIEVNLSVFQLYNANLARNILDTMRRYGVSPKHINLEITESAAVDAALISKSNLKLLMDAGLSFSLDDFGSGYSNYSILDRLPFKNVKLDISLLRNAKTYEQAKVLHEGLIASLSQSGQSLIQEGVEDRNDLEALKNVDPNIMIQGYYFSKPLPRNDFIAYLKTFKGVTARV